MKAIKYSVLIVFLLQVGLLVAQTQTKQIKENFNVNSDVVIEINTSHSDVVVEHWDKNQVSIEATLTANGMSKSEAEELFKNWKLEALGNSSKVVVTSHPNFTYHFDAMDFVFDMDLPVMDFNFEPVLAFAIDFDSLDMSAPPVMPEVAVKVLKSIEWDQKAYQKDKEKYLAEWEKKQGEWEKEIEESIEPIMEEYEKKMEKWEKEYAQKYEPKMKEYEKEMAKWEKEFEEKYAPKIKAFEQEMAEKEKKMEKQVKELEAKLEQKETKLNEISNKIVIKIPKKAKVDANTRKGSIKLPTEVIKI
ncbi:hypothetical protein KH5_01740 [Urechidicola sp. KH5]